MLPAKLTAKCAWHARAIEEAREAGLTWGEIGALFGASEGQVRMSYVRAIEGIKKGKY